MIDNLSVLYKKETIEFVVTAKEFLILLENLKASKKSTFLENSLKILSLLYNKSIVLKNPEYDDDSFLEKFVNESHWIYVQNNISEILEDDDIFVQLQDDNIISDSDYINVPISELYADLYQEMGDVIGAFKTENEDIMLAALQCCFDNFKTYWGIRVLLLLENLHKIIFNQNNELY